MRRESEGQLVGSAAFRHDSGGAQFGVAEKIRHLRAMRARTVETASAWVDLAAQAKGIAGTPLAGEEWFSGPYALVIALDRLIVTLTALAKTGAVAPQPSAHVGLT